MRATSIFRDWAGMARLPNVPTVWSNVFTAWVIEAGYNGMADNAWKGFAWLLFGGTLIYVGGAIFSEVCDVAHDRKFRPERALPAGRISRWFATIVGLSLCLIGGELLRRAAANSHYVMGLLAVVLSYAILHKKAPWLGVPLMALCRPVLVIVVMDAWWRERYYDVIGGVSDYGWIYAGILGLYVAGISWTALGEVKTWRRKAVGMMLAALPLLDAFILAAEGHYQETLVPVGCMGLAIALRKVAAAT